MRWVLYALLAIGSLVAIVVIVGLFLPATHVTSRSVAIERPPHEIWAVITDFENNPAWRSDIQRVTRLPDREGRPVWREESKGGEVIPYETVEARPPNRIVRRIADPELPFGGTWTIDITPEDGGSRVTITEHGEVRNPVYRFVSKVVIGHRKYIDAYLTALASRFGQQTKPS